MNLDGKRDEWEFQYTIAQLAEGARKQRDFRVARAKWWKEQKTRLVGELAEKGIVLSQSVIDEMEDVAADNMAMSYANTRSQAPMAGIDPNYNKQLSEAHHKVIEHRQRAEVYDGWVQLLEAQPGPGTTLQLMQTDWLFFFGKVNPDL